MLTATETLLLRFCDDERQAVALAPYVNLRQDATDQQIADAVILALVRIKEAAEGGTEIHYVSGHRRDLLREENK